MARCHCLVLVFLDTFLAIIMKMSHIVPQTDKNEPILNWCTFQLVGKKSTRLASWELNMCDFFLHVKALCSTKLITWFDFQKNTQDRRKIPEGIWERYRRETQISKELAGWIWNKPTRLLCYR